MSTNTPSEQLADKCSDENSELIAELTNETRWSKEGDLGIGDQVVAATHENRTVLELIQNARDAIRDDETTPETQSVAVLVTPEALLVANTGRPFQLHDEGVFEAVTGLGRSKKARDKGAIGEKGVGLKSILQRGDQFAIRSVLNNHRIEARFSRGRSVLMLLDAYNQILSDDDRRQQIEDAVESSEIGEYQQIITELLRNSSEAPVSDNVDVKRILEIERPDQPPTPPEPAQVLADLPRLSLFRYPFTDTDGFTSASPGRDLAELLLDGGDTEREALNVTDAALDQLTPHAGRYRSVVELDYDDDLWNSLLDGTYEQLKQQDSAAAAEFDDNRQSSTFDGPESASQQDELWRECESFSAATLVLLEDIEEIEFLRFGTDSSTEGLELRDQRKLSVLETDEGVVDSDSNVQRSVVRVTEERDAGSNVKSHWFRRYSETLDPEDYEWLGGDTATPADVEASSELRVLCEAPQPGADWWDDEEQAEPLHLYYPISEASTPFPFVVHAPFEVGFDRQQLADKAKNEDLLEKLPELIGTAAEDCAAPPDLDEISSTYSHSHPLFHEWMPWVMAPVTEPASDRDDEAAGRLVREFVEDTLAALRESPMVPAAAGGTLRPTETLLAPERLSAFEVLRQDAFDTAAAPLPTESSIANGEMWHGALPESRQSRVRSILSAIGLSDVIDRLPDTQDGPDWVTILCEAGGLDSTESVRDRSSDWWHVDVDDSDLATEYFAAVIDAFDRHRTDDGDDNDSNITDAAQNLGTAAVPLLPAERQEAVDDSDGQVESGVQVTRLVRASPSRGQSEDGRHRRNDRIVFRREVADEGGAQESTTTRLPAPPSQLPVYVIPPVAKWAGELANFNNAWGTRKLESPAGFYLRIAADAGGYSADPVDEPDPVIAYLLDLYRRIADTNPAQWLAPEPYHHRRYDEVENLLTGEPLTTKPENTEFLERRYVRSLPLPAEDGGYHRAEDLVFGVNWAAKFEDVATRVEGKPEPDSPFVDNNEDAVAERVEALRRWAGAIEHADQFRSQTTPVLAPPEDDRWQPIRDKVDSHDEGQDRWLVDFLLHLGVQVGPHIEWGWLFPGLDDSDQRTGALSVETVQELTKDPSNVEIDADTQIDPPEPLLETYRQLCWQAEHHPVFSASHSGRCQEGWLKNGVDRWDKKHSDLAIPTWWYFSELNDELAASQQRAFRDAVVLVWPEMEETIADTAWLCNGPYYSHQLGSPHHTIPALGMAQLRTSPLWPIEGDLELDVGPELEATQLITEQDARGAAQYLPRADVKKVSNQANDSVAGVNPIEATDVQRLLGELSAGPIESLTPAEAAKRLSWFVNEHTDCQSTRFEVGTERLQPLVGEWSASKYIDPVYSLMRRLQSMSHITHRVSDDDQQIQWIRRDIKKFGVRLPVRWHGESYVFAISGDKGESTGSTGVTQDIVPTIFKENLRQYARQRYRAPDATVAIVERPAQEASAIADILGDGVDDSESASPPFGIAVQSENPELESVTADTLPTNAEHKALEDLKQALNERHEILVAGYKEQATNPNVEETYETLDELFSRPLGVADVEDTAGRNSAEWIPDSEDGRVPSRIAVYGRAIEEHAPSDGSDSEAVDDWRQVEEIPRYLAADALEQILDNYGLGDVFENILMKGIEVGRAEYKDTIEQIEKSREDYETRELKRVHSALEALVRSQNAGASPPDIVGDHGAALDALTNPPESSTHSFLEEWMAVLESVGLPPEQCIEAATAEDHITRQLKLAQLLREYDGVERVLDEDEWRSLRTLRGSRDIDELRLYLDAVEKVEAFFSQLDRRDRINDDAIVVALQAVEEATPPSAFDTVGEIVPNGEKLPQSIRSQFVVELLDIESEASNDDIVPMAIIEAVEQWCQDRYEALRDASITTDQDILSKVESLIDAVATPSEAKGQIQEVLQEALREDAGQRSPSQQSQRRKKTLDWVANDADEVDDVVEDNVESTTFEPEEPGDDMQAPSINDTQSSGRQNAEISDGRGRDAELICLSRAWDRFRTSSSTCREAIVDEVERWRSCENWRLKPLDKLTIQFETGNSSEDTVSVLRRYLCASEVEDSEPARRAFHAVFDTSAERGPGFDYIDPFAGLPMSVDADTDWRPDSMRRVEVKAVHPNRADSGRIKLTGNEFRMARRPGPTLGEHGAKDSIESVDRYLLRLVVLPTNWDAQHTRDSGIELRDITDFVAYTDFDSDGDPYWEKLRGGSFYVGFEYR
ncbi:hypothetical protein SAMN05216559_1859 [Halomicrobium zhouii]|uniref:Uncharacterized protein n=1 Tax=Halomicrobium zhouii TaxID=767519 RepID=A0A1I6L1Z5_9EURY|nr:hypothetical protein [Halomicrobium zhouii]SFR97467.1 hypothetical protein SAMN05216559_1859 [Halomicrobium zhouii]